MIRSASARIVPGLVIVASLALASAVGAQPAGAPALLAPPSVGDSLLVLIEMRSRDAISHDLEEFAVQRGEAERMQQQAKSLLLRSETQIKVKSSEIESIEAQVDLAKQEKDYVRQSEHESRKKLAQLEKQLLETRKTLRDREIHYWTTSMELADLRTKQLGFELELAGKREQRNAVTGQIVSPDVLSEFQKVEREITDLERKTLDAQIAAADKRKQVAEQEIEVAKARRKIYDAQLKVLRGS